MEELRNLLERGRNYVLQLVERRPLADDEHLLLRNVLDLDLAADVGSRGHELLLSFDESLQRVQDLLCRRRQLGHLRPVLQETRASEGWVVCLDDRVDLVQRELEEAERRIAAASSIWSVVK